LKDLIDAAGTRTTAGSALYENRVPTEDAEVVGRLRRAGAVILGKNNLHEFAYGGSSLVSFFGDVHNPGMGRISREDRPEDRRPRLLPGFVTRQLGLIRPAPFVNRLRCAGA